VSKKPRSIAFYVYTGSVVFHVALALGAVVLPKPKRSDVVAIQLAEAKKKKDPPKPPPAPLPPPPAEKPKPKAVAEPRAQAKVAPQETKAPEVAPIAGGSDGFADLGISLGNADGPGIAVPAAATATAATAPTAAVTPTKKVQQLVAPTQGTDVCNDPLVRPKRKVPVAPKYTMQARQAEIEGVVRVEVTVDESGHVLSARVLSGLGYGLDESAIAAAKATTFEPATRCGKAVVGTAVLPFRFEQT
jgi:protein TonB